MNENRFGTAAVIRGLNEAKKDPTIKSVILRVDSGGGGVVESDSIWAAVRELQKEKAVVASFGNCAASGGYLVATRELRFFSPNRKEKKKAMKRC